ncbi:L-rhamnose mutarotase [Niabella ginsengisoli]|uniref:L-rhamnose mutarotase n=1 Tax=Niabella ginsengisoli TaxID=522298 RepID=A0ABS9SFS8_9BACT|nr:L-rhamnose mutarotase [Niabella ginsengisoli]MCH5597222.1 L-rhamnose mutarotase [Niabella ginsengisoli]
MLIVCDAAHSIVDTFVFANIIKPNNMQRIAFKMKLLQGFEEEYKKDMTTFGLN